ncbi:MAG: DNA-3-methyladenine glycosylase [Acidobacteria bacterium OLB17]|nr:MAG: DNA-3-methyladenine glycosylase [Acidobacteria bacterium OLB17]MCZ2390062.1 DNA-3-methyladenine glycosylase [Acidobacteriota bacterium]
MPLPRKFYSRKDTARIARELLGKLLVVESDEGRVSGMIVETEAYLGEADRAAHSYGGRRTPRNEVMYGRAGFVYVFFVYGMYFQFNCVTGRSGVPHAILIRGIEPIEGVEIMQRRRPKARKLSEIASGPGKLCIAMGIDRSFNGADLLGKNVFIEKFRRIDDADIETGRRIGIDYAGEDAALPLRFWIRGNECVSRRR